MRKKGVTSLGRHLLVEFHGCDRTILNDEKLIRRYMLEAAKLTGATILKDVFHAFSPHGVSGVVVIAESHLAIHTWPEYGYAAVDLFTCGNNVDPWRAFEFLSEKLKAKRYLPMEIKRGILELEEAPVYQQQAVEV